MEDSLIIKKIYINDYIINTTLLDKSYSSSNWCRPTRVLEARSECGHLILLAEWYKMPNRVWSAKASPPYPGWKSEGSYANRQLPIKALCSVGPH